MNLRKHAVLLTGGVIALALTLAGAYFLLHYRSGYVKVQEELATVGARMDQLSRRNPFPSEENVGRATESLTAMERKYEEVLTALSKDSQPGPDMEPAQFAGYGRRLMEKLTSLARTNSVTVPDNFMYGFNRYARGAIPAKEDLPRLVRQIGSVTRVIEAVFSAQVREIRSVERHVFEDEVKAETAPAAAAAVDPLAVLTRRARPAVTGDVEMPSAEAAAGYRESPDGLFYRERVILTFIADEKQLWSTLNALARLPMISSVAWLEVTNSSPKPTAVDPKKAAEGMPATPVRGAEAATRAPGAGEIDEIIVAGNVEELKVRMAVDYFHFRTGVPGSAKEKNP